MSNPHAQLLADLHVAHRPRLERLVTRRVRDPEAAADLVSEAFLRLYRELGADRMPDEPAAWLTRVALNLVISEWRHRRVVDVAGPRLAWVASAPEMADALAIREELRETLRALEALPDRDRELVLRAAAGASAEALGRSQGMSPGAARVRLCRARMHLRVTRSAMR
jgi:RNA polymerase sigma factor (sigma-70 family)